VNDPAKIGEAGPSSIPKLLVKLGHTSPYIRSGAVTALGKFLRTNREVLPPILAALKGDADKSVRSSAVWALRGDTEKETSRP